MAKRFFTGFIVSALVTALGSYASAGTALIKTDQFFLCPKADHQESIKINERIISAPKILEEKELLKRLRSKDEDESRTAAITLALGGNLQAFSYLLEKRDMNLLSMYGTFYQNRNGTRCIDPFIEEEIVRNIDDPEMREYLLAFLGKNLYQSRELFDALRSVDLVLRETRVTTAMIRSLVATRQPNIEKEVLDHATRNTVNVELGYWHMLLPIDKYYLDFFVERNYKPAVAHMQTILDETHYSLVPNSQKTHVYNRQHALYYQLDKFPSSLVEEVFAKQLSKLEQVVRDEVYFNIELEAAGRYALKHALTYEGRDDIVQYVAGILESEQVYDPSASERAISVIDYKMRSNAIDFLAQAETSDSGFILVEELNRQTERTDAKGATALISKILNSLSALPASVEIDVPQFMTAVNRMDKRSQLLIVPEILKQHPHPEGHAFLLTHLREIVLTGDGYRLQYGMDYKTAYKIIFDILITFDAADYLFLTRQQIDSLFEEGSLDEALYVSSSKRLNALIGNESALYTAFREKKDTEEIERRRKLGRAEEANYRQYFEDQIAENMSPEGIRANIHALSQQGSRSKNAALWLVITGPDILPSAHEALLSPDADIQVKSKLISILGAIGDARSTGPIIESVREEHENIRKRVFLALSEMPMTEESFDFAASQLTEERAVIARRSALVYFAAQRDRRALNWAKKYSLPQVHQDLRRAALFLLARLGDPDAKGFILEELKKERTQSNLETLLRSLAEVTTPEEFVRHTGTMNLNEKTKWYQSALWITEFRHAEGERKAVFAERLLISEHGWDRREASRYLIENKKTEILQRHLLSDPRVELPLIMEAMQSRAGRSIYIEARKMGYVIEEKEEGIRLFKE